MTAVAVVLAAGSARRFGSDKLSAGLEGEPLVFHAVRAARAAPVEQVIVVGHPELEVGQWDDAPPVELTRIASTALSASLRAGLERAGQADRLFVFLGDMPWIPHDIAPRLAVHLGSAYAAVPRTDGKPGHPVLLSSRAFADIAALKGDAGLGKLLRSRDDVAFVECANPSIHADVDRPEDLHRLP